MLSSTTVLRSAFTVVLVLVFLQTPSLAFLVEPLAVHIAYRVGVAVHEHRDLVTLEHYVVSPVINVLFCLLLTMAIHLSCVLLVSFTRHVLSMPFSLAYSKSSTGLSAKFQVSSFIIK